MAIQEDHVKLFLIIFRAGLVLILLTVAATCLIIEKGPKELWILIVGNCIGYTFSSRLKKKTNKGELELDDVDGNYFLFLFFFFFR